MQATRRNIGIGLDIGQTTVKALRVDRRGKGVALSRAALFDIREEGILDESELSGSMAAWLKDELKWQDQRLCVALPQYLATTQISDFTAGVKPDELAKMVHYETRQLAGLSEESFIYDYQTMTPAHGRSNPVLIGICRETAIDEQVGRLTALGLHVGDVAMSGLAAVNALVHLHPEEGIGQEPRLVIDIGHENSTVLIMAGGEVLYVGSMMFGSLRFTQALAHALGCSEAEAESLKRTLSLENPSHGEALLLAMRQLETELRTAIDHWRGGEHSDLAEMLIQRIWLCGGGAQLPGLAEHLARTYSCEVSLFGPEVDGKQAPGYAIAFGLALQGLGAAHFSISLVPTLLRWQKEREARFPYLAGALALFFVLVFAALSVVHISSVSGKERVEEQLAELKLCQSLNPQLDAAKDQLAFFQKMMLPFVEFGLRSHRYVKAIETLQESFSEGVWSVYVADEFSHRATALTKDERPRPAAPAGGGTGAMFGTAPTAPDKADGADLGFVDVGKLPLLKYMVVGGFTPVIAGKRFDAVLTIQKNLNSSGYFLGVDWLDESTEWTGRELEVLEPWTKFLLGFQANATSRRPAVEEYTQFFLKLPLAQEPVTLPLPPPPKVKSSQK